MESISKCGCILISTNNNDSNDTVHHTHIFNNNNWNSNIPRNRNYDKDNTDEKERAENKNREVHCIPMSPTKDNKIDLLLSKKGFAGSIALRVFDPELPRKAREDDQQSKRKLNKGLPKRLTIHLIWFGELFRKLTI